MRNLKLVYLLIMLLCSGCATPLKPEQRVTLREQRENATNKARQKVEQRALEVHVTDNRTYDIRTNPEDILVYFKNPKKIYDSMNKDLYIMGEYTEPQKRYVKIAKVSVGRTTYADASALGELKKGASEAGGDGLIDVYREPVAGGVHEDSYVSDVFWPVIPDNKVFARDVAGFVYKGTVIRFKDIEVSENRGDISTGKGLYKTEETAERQKLYKSRRALK